MTTSNYERQCVASAQGAGNEIRRCQREAVPSDPLYITTIPICSWHENKARSQFAARLEDEITELKAERDAHECDGLRAVEQYTNSRVDWQIQQTEKWRKESFAYFIRCGEYIKIGASQSPVARAESIRTIGGVLTPAGLDLQASELVATEPGGFPREAELHAKFAHLRHTGEWFTEDPELTEYIDSLTTQAA